MPLPGGAVAYHDDLPAAVAEAEAAGGSRWVLADVARDYPPLLAAGARLDRCRDLRLAERILSRVEANPIRSTAPPCSLGSRRPGSTSAAAPARPDSRAWARCSRPSPPGRSWPPR
jgi:hypothetical protein